MNDALNSFKALIAQTNTTAGLFRYIQEQRIPIDASDLLRWEWVLAVSAFDKYIHDIIRVGMIEEFLGRRPETDKYKTFRISMPSFHSMKNSTSPELEFEKEIIQKFKTNAYQAPDKVSDGLSYIWVEQHKWQIISTNMRSTISESDLRTKLNNIVLRRNQIVHEGDCIPAIIPLQQEVINETDTRDVVNFITELVDAIHLSIT